MIEYDLIIYFYEDYFSEKTDLKIIKEYLFTKNI